MGIKLYPPYIAGVIPAFVKGTEIAISIPYSMNRSVSKTQIQGFSLKIKSVQTNNFLLTLTSNEQNLNSILENNVAVFNISADNTSQLNIFNTGCYYKMQLAYINDNTVGYYSTIGIIKCTTQPEVFIKGFESENISANKQSYTGVYNQFGKDLSEKVYQYKFDLYRVNDALMVSQHELVESSNWLLHDSTTDVNSYESTDNYLFSTSLKSNIPYKIQYSIKTNNWLEVKSPYYTVIEKNGVTPEINAYLKYDVNYDNGYIRLHLEPYKWTSTANGAFLISRASSEDDYEIWHELERFTLRNGDSLSSWELKDFTVKQGIKYIYAIQQYNSKGLYSSRLRATGKDNESIYAYADFEDSFLFDGEKQLKIRFNSKISSFKTNKLESKIDTIGSKYPFIFRNGKVDYKEFQISGLISYWSDEEHLFLSDEEMGLNGELSSNQRTYFNSMSLEDYNELDLRPWTTSQVSYNIAAERIFKLKVMEWLGNGKPKLLRTPTEGNYLIKLMNIAFTPEDKLNRMIHNFSATAYEIADTSYASLGKYKIIAITEQADTQYRIMTFDFYNNGQPHSGYSCEKYEKDGDSALVTRNYTKDYSGYHMRLTPTINQSTNNPVLSGYSIDGNIEIGDVITLTFNASASIISQEPTTLFNSKLIIASASDESSKIYNLLYNRNLQNITYSYTWTKYDSLPLRIYWSADSVSSEVKYYTLDLKSVTINKQEILNSTFTSTISPQEKTEKLNTILSQINYYEEKIIELQTDTNIQESAINLQYSNNEININQKYTALNNLLSQYNSYFQIYKNKLNELKTEKIEVQNLMTNSFKINKFNAYEYIKFRDIMPGTKFSIYDQTAEETISVVIGITGSYTVQIEDHIFSSIQTVGDFPTSGFIDYKYIAEVENIFEEINDIEIQSIYGRSFIGPMTIIDENLEQDQINDIKHSLVSFYYTNFYTKNIRVLKLIENIYYNYDEKNNILGEEFTTFIDIEIYKIYSGNSFNYYLGSHDSNNLIQDNIIDYSINIDGENLLLTPDSEEGLLNHLLNGFKDQNFSKITIGNGIVLDCAYTISNTIYNVEIENSSLAEALENYNTDYNSGNFSYQQLDQKWNNYCAMLKESLRR